MLEDKWLSPGEVLDSRYKIVKLIKSGGMGAVYQAEDAKMGNRICAVKQMLDSFTDSGERSSAIDRFLSEIQVLGHLRHPNIPQVTDHFLERNSFYFVMEYIEGKDLSTILHAEGTPGLPEDRVLRIAIEVCEALKYIHGLDTPFAHRDIKPSNLLQRTRDSRILLIDFGIARVTNPQEGYWIGTPGYAPPEQQAGKPELRSDIYALGAAMHELLSGKRPDDFVFAAFADFGVTVSERLEELITHALMWNPEERLQSALQFQQSLIEILGYNPVDHEENGEFAFVTAVQKFKSEVLDSLLYDIITRYGNECHTRFLPKHLDYLVITLACPTCFELIIKKNDLERTLEFYEKQGILDPQLLGSLDPKRGEEGKARALVERFVSDYEEFKNANWQIM
ncbi:MAG: serine/threonine-protein kinase [Candidatus Eremiobacteraeota bacterium]|nr:serine/threonine-protein kinase [Candidatus Eremiobacteraeota bacterium]